MLNKVFWSLKSRFVDVEVFQIQADMNFFTYTDSLSCCNPTKLVLVKCSWGVIKCPFCGKNQLLKIIIKKKKTEF